MNKKIKNKTLVRMTVSIPEYIYEIIKKINEEYPSTTMNGTMNAIIEKGAYWYRKKQKAAKEELEQTSKSGNPDTQDNNQEQQQDTTPRLTWEHAYQQRIALYPVNISEFWKKIEPDPQDFQFPWEYLEKWKEWKKEALADCK